MSKTYAMNCTFQMKLPTGETTDLEGSVVFDASPLLEDAPNLAGEITNLRVEWSPAVIAKYQAPDLAEIANEIVAAYSDPEDQDDLWDEVADQDAHEAGEGK